MKTPAPSPSGTNRANLFLQGSAARAVRCGRALQGAAYDARFGLDQAKYQPKSLDEHLANETIMQIRDALKKEGFDKKIVDAVIYSLCGADPEAVVGGEDEDDDDRTDKSSSTQAMTGDDPPDFQGKPNKGAAPSPSKGTVAKDGRPNWLRQENPNAQGEAHARMLKNMSRIGHCWVI